MTTWNGSRFVREAVDSLLAQTLTSFELIVVDDASSDDTVALVEGYGDPRIRLHRNAENLGIAGARNVGLALARGEFVAAHDQDDLSLPQRLARQVDYLDRHPGAVLVASAYRELRGTRVRPLHGGELRPHVAHCRLYTRGGFAHSTLCFRRSVQVAHGIRYEPGYPYADDLLLLHRFAEVGDVVSLPEELVTYRDHSDNTSKRNEATMSESGRRIYHGRVGEYLGLTWSDVTRDAVWETFWDGVAPRSEAVLVAAGQSYRDVVARLARRRGLGARETDELWGFASESWWRAVSAFARTRGRSDVVALYRRVADLAATPPPRWGVLSTRLRVWLPRVPGRPSAARLL
jgi:glycosyltransferase involved in cell wall biosynthesis